MWPGRVVLGRYKVRAPLAGTADLVRWEAEDTAGGTTVEIVAPTGIAALRPRAAETFARAMQGLPEHPAILGPLATGTEGSLPVAVRPPIQGLWDPARRIDADLALALAAWLGPAVAAAASQLGEGLRAEDLVIDPDGVVRLAPTGLRANEGIVPPPRHRAPELGPGGQGDASAALYGLGVLLFRALTGEDAVPGTTTTAWAAAQRTPRRAAALLPQTPAALDGLLAGLLSPDPALRLTTLAALPPGTPTRLPAETRAAPPSPAVTATRPASAAHADLGLAPWVVSVDPAALSESAQRRAAALAGAPGAAMGRLARAHLPAPIIEARSRPEAEARALELGAAGLPTRVQSGEAPWGLSLAAALCLGLAILLGIGGIFFHLLLAIAALLGVAGLATAAVALARGRAVAALTEGKGALHSGEPSANGAAEAQIRGHRLVLLRADLPDPMRLDLLAALDEVEDRLDALTGDDAPARAAILADANAIATAATPTPAALDPNRTEARLRAVRATLADPGA